ncbi:hypothetical protein HMPREF0541_00298 [Lacticaseibacillus rhamnosus ATCC 21052]|nr:hypothetical protein HMPREF0541_00298 [Lacticaseibacillus rhamnosus ATCC 21052]
MVIFLRMLNDDQSLKLKLILCKLKSDRFSHIKENLSDFLAIIGKD